MTIPSSDFAAAYRRHVLPKLRSMIASRGLFVALRLDSFGEAHAEIMGEAGRLGAWNLSTEHLDNLIEWTQLALREAAVAAQERHDVG
jgi:hypothetical protein